MERKLTVKIESDSSQAQASIGKLRDELKAAQDNVKAMADEFGALSPQAEAATKVVMDLEVQIKDATHLASQIKLPDEPAKGWKAQLKDAKTEMQSLIDKFGELSPEVAKAAKKVAELEDKIGDSKKLTDAFNPDAKFKGLSGAIQGAVGAFTALQGAQALFGSESKEVAQTLAKVQGALAFSQGINSVLEAKDSIKAFGAQLMSLNVVQKVVTAAQWLWNAAIAANPIGAIVAAVAALIAGIVALTKYFIDNAAAAKENEKQVKAHAKALEEQNKQLERSSQELERNQNFTLALAKAKGTSAEEIRKLELKLADEKIANEASQRAIALNTFYTEQNTLAKLKAAGASDEVIKKQQETTNKSLEAANKETKDLQAAYDARAVLLGNHVVQIAQEKTDAAKKEQEIEKQNQDKLKQLREEAQKDLIERLKRNAEYQAETEKQLQQQRLDLIKEGQYKERLQLDMKHDDDIAAIIKYQEDEQKTLDEQLKKKTITQAQYNEQLITVQKNANDRRTVIDEAYNQGVIDINDKYHKIEQQQLQDHLQKLNDIQQGTADIQNQNKLNLMSKALQDQFNLELDYQKKIDEALKILDNASLGSEEERQKAYNERRLAVDEEYNQKRTGLAIDRANADVERIMNDGNASLSAQRAVLDESDKILEDSFKNKQISEEKYNDNVKKNAEIRKRIDEAEKANKKAQVKAVSDILGGLSDVIGKQTKAGKAAAIAGLLIQQGQSVANIITSTRSAVQKDNDISPTTLGLPWSAIHIAQGAIGVAQAIKATRDGIKQIKSAGEGGGEGSTASPADAGGASPTGATPPMPATPDQTILPQAQIDQIASANAATKAYVLESDVTNNQERIIRLNRAARIN